MGVEVQGLVVEDEDLDHQVAGGRFRAGSLQETRRAKAENITDVTKCFPMTG